MLPVCNQIKSKCREVAGNGWLRYLSSGRNSTDPSIATLLPMLVGGILIVVIGIIVGLIVY